MISNSASEHQRRDRRRTAKRRCDTGKWTQLESSKHEVEKNRRFMVYVKIQ